MKNKPHCLKCESKPVDKEFHPFCGKNCAAEYAVAQFDGTTLYCQEHGWVTWGSTDKRKKPTCGFEHKKKQS